MAQENQPIFMDINADSSYSDVMEIKSLCMNCHEQGNTRLMLTKIPFFKEVIISSFECPECHMKDSEIKSAGVIQDKGSKITLNVKKTEDLNRQLVKTDSAAVSIPELGFEIPPFSQKGLLTTIEGLLTRAIDGLLQEQPVRKIMDPKGAESIDAFVEKLRKCLEVEKPFTFILNDISGNSFLENPFAPNDDPELTLRSYTRNSAQNMQLGLAAEEEEEEKTEAEIGKDEILSFPTNCNNCGSPTPCRMKPVSIPHFKEVIIMAIACDKCGYKSNEVKSGAGIEEKGTRISFRITDPTDLNRDVLKSDTCSLKLPEVDFEVHAGSLGGRFTTLEGLLTQARDQLKMINPFGFGDSGAQSFSTNMRTFVEKIDKIIAGEEMGVTLIMDDPTGNSYLQNIYAPDSDPELNIEHYERTAEQNEELGLNDMKTEDYHDS